MIKAEIYLVKNKFFLFAGCENSQQALTLATRRKYSSEHKNRKLYKGGLPPLPPYCFIHDRIFPPHASAAKACGRMQRE